MAQAASARPRCGPMVYFGSSAEANPALKTAHRSQTELASSATAPAATTGRDRLAPAAIRAAPTTVRPLAASASLPAVPVR